MGLVAPIPYNLFQIFGIFYGRGTIFLLKTHFVWGSNKKFWSETIFFGNIRNIRNIGNIRKTFFDQRSPQHLEFSVWGWGSYNLCRITDPPFLIVSSQTNIRTMFFDQSSSKHPEQSPKKTNGPFQSIGTLGRCFL